MTEAETPVVAAPPVKRAGNGRPLRGRQLGHQMGLVLEPLDFEMVKEAARIFGQQVSTWVRRAAVWEALRVRIAATSVPHGLHPGAPLYRVTAAPVGGVWSLREEFVSDGSERVWVSSLVEDAPISVSPDHKAFVIDVVGCKVHSLLVRWDALRWHAITPLAFPYWDLAREWRKTHDTKKSKVAEATP